MKVRRADLAGSWYPAGASDCRRTIEGFIESAMPCPGIAGDVVGGIVPHAGWVFSGKIAMNVVHCMRQQDEPDICIIFGRHLHASSENVIMREGRWSTPLGALEIDSELARALTSEFSFDVETTTRYAQDNTVEVQLPFLKYCFPDIRILPMGLPPHPSSLEIADRAIEISREMGRKSVVIGSTDLTHYGHNYGYLPKGSGEKAVEWVKQINDKRAVDLMVGMDEKTLIEESSINHNVCCPGAAAAAIVAARALGATKATKMAYSTSYDVSPDSSFVGYAGIAFGGALS